MKKSDKSDTIKKMNRLTPLKAIRKYCLWCCIDSANEVKLCHSVECSLHPVRDGKRHRGTIKLTPLKIIKLKCLDCSDGIKSEVKNCQETDCYLYIFRFGKNPNRVGIGNRNAKFCEKTRTHIAFDDMKPFKEYQTMGSDIQEEKTLVEIGEVIK